MPKLNYMISDVVAWIDENIEKPLKIEDISKKAGYSKWHLQRVFQLEKKTTIACYIRNKKLLLAASDLVSTNDSILVISIKYGFDSQQSFTRVFTSKFQVPPTRYRSLYKEQKFI